MLENNQKKELVLLQDLGMRFPTTTSKQKVRYGLYKCFCGEQFETQIYRVKNNHCNSCGCVKHKHMLSSHPLYYVFNEMKGRCFNVNHKAYINYGERGITVCNEWLNDFMSFYTWALENGYKDDLSIDRINNDGNYEPNNCRWVGRQTQSRNTRKIISTNTSGYRGVSLLRKKYQAKISVNNKQIYLGIFANPLDGALAYDKYIIDNNLEHTRNF